MAQAVCASLLILPWLLSQLCAQTTWERTQFLPFLPGREGHAMAEDQARQRVVLFGGRGSGLRNDTWEWDGTRWTERQPLHRPPARERHGMAYDPVGARVLMFGGWDQSRFFDDTWAWDGSDWQQLLPLHRPAPRVEFAMTTDLWRAVVLVHGGWSSTASLDDLWAWSGSDWVQHMPTSRPSARFCHALAFDLLRGVTVLYGGISQLYGGPSRLIDTWEWDGTRWSLAPFTNSPGIRQGAAMGFSLLRGRVVLFGGSTATPGTWEWNGADWTQVWAPIAPSERMRPAMAVDLTRGKLLMFGGLGGGELADTWEIDANGWSLVADASVPTARTNPAFGYDPLRRRCVLFGGLSRNGAHRDTWELVNDAWQRRTPATVPIELFPLGMVWDSHRSRMVLLLTNSMQLTGGLTVWEWDGTDWRHRALASPPPATQNLAVAFDERRGRLTVFGGLVYQTLTVPADTWELDQTGAAWRMVASTGPSARDASALAYDPVRGVMLLFGGRSRTYQHLVDTWQWDGVGWTQLFPAHAPPPMLGLRMVWDTARRRLVLGGWARETWEWDGTDWQLRATSQEPPSVSGAGMAYDRDRQQVVLFGGQLTFTTNYSAEHWQYRALAPASHATYGRGCPGGNGIPALSSDFGPWRGSEFVQRVDPPAPGVLLVGASRTVWGGQPLPFDLGPIGMPGCALRASTTLVLPLLPDASARLSIPDDGSLVGATFYNQAVQLAPGANPLGAVMSDAAAAIIGAR